METLIRGNTFIRFFPDSEMICKLKKELNMVVEQIRGQLGSSFLQNP